MMPRYDTLDCPEFREEVMRAVCQTYGFRPAKKKEERKIRPLFLILASERERTIDQHKTVAQSLSSAIGGIPQTPDVTPSVDDFRMVNNLIMFARAKNRMRGNSNAKRQKNVSEGN